MTGNHSITPASSPAASPTLLLWALVIVGLFLSLQVAWTSVHSQADVRGHEPAPLQTPSASASR
jgi:hypothetical protein